jgi:hypothetical protein
MYPVEAAIVTSCHSGLGGRGCGHSLGIKPHGIDAVCTDCHPYRRRVDGDRRDAIVELDCLFREKTCQPYRWQVDTEAYSTVRIRVVLVLPMVLITSPWVTITRSPETR